MLFGYVHGQGVRWQLIDACSKTASCTRALHQAGDGRIAQLVLDDCVDLGCHTSLVLLSARGRRLRGVAKSPRSAGTASSSSSPRTRVAAETKDTSTRRPRTARSRSGPARTPWTEPGHDTESPASPTGLPVGDDAALCAKLASQPPSTGNPKPQASRRSRQPPDHVDTVGPPRRYPSRSTAA